jgi:hypothetical protein
MSFTKTPSPPAYVGGVSSAPWFQCHSTRVTTPVALAEDPARKPV